MTTTGAAEAAEVGEIDPTHPAPSDGTRSGSDGEPTGTAPREAPGDEAPGEFPDDETAEGEAPGDEAPNGETSGGRRPYGETPDGETPDGMFGGDEASGDDPRDDDATDDGTDASDDADPADSTDPADSVSAVDDDTSAAVDDADDADDADDVNDADPADPADPAGLVDDDVPGSADAADATGASDDAPDTVDDADDTDDADASDEADAPDGASTPNDADTADDTNNANDPDSTGSTGSTDSTDSADDVPDDGVYGDDPEVTAVIRLPLRPMSPPPAPPARAPEAPSAPADDEHDDEHEDKGEEEDEDRAETTAEMRLPGRAAPLLTSAPRKPSAAAESPEPEEPEEPESPWKSAGMPDDEPWERDAGASRRPSEVSGSLPEVTEAPAAHQAPQAPQGSAGTGSRAGRAPATSAMPPVAAAVGAPAATPAARPSRMRAVMQSAMVWLPPVLTIEGLIMYVLALRVAPGPLRGVDLNDIDGVGLISAMPPTAFAAILLMLVAFFVTIAQNTDRKFLLLFQIAAITFALHGAAALIEDEARFHTAYVHAGFVEYINRTGEASALLDARLAWPGFFALVGFVTKAAGVTDLTTIMRWTPLLSNLLYLLPFVLILRQVVATTRARWFAALLFVIVQWIGQDYFSSQGFTYAIYLAFVAIVLRWFGKVEPRDKPMPAKGFVRRLLARLDGLTPGELPHSTGVYDRAIMLIVLIGLFATATASHQITPFMMLGALTGLILLRRSSLSWGLPFFLGLMVLAWISYQTVAFWSGHIDQLFGGLGRILENLQSNTGDRIDGSDPKHALVLMARLGICGVILTLAAAGLFRRLRRGVGDRAALLLLCIPVLALGLQNYGGEIGLRIYLFALPGACILAAYAFFPNLPAGTEDAPEETVPIRKRNIRFNPELTRRISLLLAAGCAMVLAMVFLVARYGNEQFERVSASEVAAMHYVYDHDKPSARVLYLVPVVGEEVTPSIPWGERDFDKISYQQVLVDKNPAQLSTVIDKLRVSPPNTYLVATRGQAGYLQLNHGFPTDWAPRFRAALDAHKELKRVFNGEDAAVYTLRKYPEGAEIPEPGVPTGGSDPTSPWTPVGLGALGVTWIALFGYEVFRLRGRDQAARTRRRILFVAVPAFVLAVGVIVERFIVIGS
ncbi:hypothetical protein [Streptosporangium sp. NPDC048865]|uniref:hypothetical protein n=1 Tax=Streptosporangium sp. NPDC048865 TaxID=3155766 RepID=UPI003449C944